MLQTEVHEEVFFDVTPSGSLRPERRLIYRLVGNLKADRGQPCYEFAREVDVVQKRNGCVGPVR
ncbi:hypothetical protein MJ122_27660 [Pseudomonas sp. DP-17]|nr:hypothetical protein [Pseudomonas sp. DP-17]